VFERKKVQSYEEQRGVSGKIIFKGFQETLRIENKMRKDYIKCKAETPLFHSPCPSAHLPSFSVSLDSLRAIFIIILLLLQTPSSTPKRAKILHLA